MTEPTAKAKTSVRLVMVTATPACFRVSPIASDRGRPEKNAKIILNKSSNKDDICVKRNILGQNGYEKLMAWPKQCKLI